MTENLDKILVEKYPKIFANRYKDMKETAMCWGFECHDGWYWLIDQLCSSLQNYIDWNGKEQVVATQVKEKFGTLRFYVTGGDELTSGMIWLAEAMSRNVCELCGSTTDIGQTSGWIMTSCKSCADSHNFQHWKPHNKIIS